MIDKYFDAIILDKQKLTNRITEFKIGTVDGQSLPLASAGDHIELKFGGSNGQFLRHYSIVGPLTTDVMTEPFWRIAVQREDRARGSAYIHTYFKKGVQLKVSHPINAFRLVRHLPHVLLIAGGIGITPILPMLRSLLIRNQSFSMFYAGANRNMMAYADDVLKMGGNRVQLHEADTEGVANFSALLASQPPQTVVYICGPSRMIESLRAVAQAQSWTNNRVKFEVFNAAHRPEDTDFSVRLKSGQIIEVGAGTTILDALERAHIDTLSNCRRGECGLCLTGVVNAHEGIDHRDSYMTTSEKATNEQLTICCSRAEGKLIELDIK